MQGVVDSLIGHNVIECIAESPRGSGSACTNNGLSFISQATKRFFTGWKVGLQDFMEDSSLLRLFFCLPLLLNDAKDVFAEILRGSSLAGTHQGYKELTYALQLYDFFKLRVHNLNHTVR